MYFSLKCSSLSVGQETQSKQVSDPQNIILNSSGDPISKNAKFIEVNFRETCIRRMT